MRIYFPLTCNILTKGHIRALEILSKLGFIKAGLLTAKALKGYKKELMPYEDREYILKTIAKAIGNIKVVPQDSLDPTENIKLHKCSAIASGDGWHKKELKAIKKLKLKIINFNTGDTLHSSDIYK